MKMYDFCVNFPRLKTLEIKIPYFSCSCNWSPPNISTQDPEGATPGAGEEAHGGCDYISTHNPAIMRSESEGAAPGAGEGARGGCDCISTQPTHYGFWGGRCCDRRPPDRKWGILWRHRTNRNTQEGQTWVYRGEWQMCNVLLILFKLWLCIFY